MEFIGAAYIFLMPFLLAAFLLINKSRKPFVLGFISVSNILLLLHSLFLIRQLYMLYHLALSSGLNPSGYHYAIGWFEIRLLLLVLLPLLFIIKKFSSNILLTAVMLVLLCWNNIPTFFAVFSNEAGLLFKTLNYFCLFIAAYALLWLLKRLPHQQQ